MTFCFGLAPTAFTLLVPTAYFTNLLSAPLLTHLTFRPINSCQTCLNDKFLSDAFQIWRYLHTLDLAPSLLKTQITLNQLGVSSCQVTFRVFRVRLNYHRYLRIATHGWDLYSVPSDMGAMYESQKFHERSVTFLKEHFLGLRVVETRGHQTNGPQGPAMVQD